MSDFLDQADEFDVDYEDNKNVLMEKTNELLDEADNLLGHDDNESFNEKDVSIPLNSNNIIQRPKSDIDIKQCSELYAEVENFFKDKYNILASDEFDPIPTGIDILDAYLGGGIAKGGFIQFVGNPGCGKSALASRILANCQRIYPNKFIGLYADSEEATSKERLMQLGVKYPPINPINDLTLEKVFKLISGIATFKSNNPKLLDTPSLIIWDSIANTQPEKTDEIDDIDKIMGLKARILSGLLPKYMKIMKKFNITVLAINQLRDKIDMGVFKQKSTLRYLANKEIPGGKSILFNSTQLLLLSAGKELDEEYGFKGGSEVDIKCVKNRLFRPNLEFKLVMSFNLGYSDFWSTFGFLKEVKRIKSGAWCTLEGYNQVKFRQKDAIQYYKTDPEFRRIFDSHVKETIQSEIIDKNKTLFTDDMEEDIFK